MSSKPESRSRDAIPEQELSSLSLLRLVRNTRATSGAALAIGLACLAGFGVRLSLRNDAGPAIVMVTMLLALSLPLVATIWQLGFRFVPQIASALCALDHELRGDPATFPSQLDMDARRIQLGCNFQGCTSGCLLFPVTVGVLEATRATMGMRLGSYFFLVAVPAGVLLPLLLGAFLKRASDGLLLVRSRLARSDRPLHKPVEPKGRRAQTRLATSYSAPWLGARKAGRLLCIVALLIASVSLGGAAVLGLDLGQRAGLKGENLYILLGVSVLACAFAGAIFALGAYALAAGRAIEGLVAGTADLRAARSGKFLYAKPIPTERLAAASGATRIFGILSGLLGSLFCLGSVGVNLQSDPSNRALVALFGAFIFCLLGILPCLLGSLAATAGDLLMACCRTLEERILACEQEEADGRGAGK